MYAGDTVVLNVSAKEADGSVLDLTGLSIMWAMGRSNNSTALLSKSVGHGVTIVNAQNGEFRVTLAQNETATLNGSYYHEIRVADGDTSSVILAGSLEFTPTITKG